MFGRGFGRQCQGFGDRARHDDRAVARQGRTGRTIHGRQTFDIARDLLGKPSIRRDENGARVRVMLGLGNQIRWQSNRLARSPR